MERDTLIIIIVSELKGRPTICHIIIISLYLFFKMRIWKKFKVEFTVTWFGSGYDFTPKRKIHQLNAMARTNTHAATAHEQALHSTFIYIYFPSKTIIEVGLGIYAKLHKITVEKKC